MIALKFENLIALLAEMANGGRPIFPGSDVDDQLKRIFRHVIFINGRYSRQKVARLVFILICMVWQESYLK